MKKVISVIVLMLVAIAATSSPAVGEAGTKDDPVIQEIRKQVKEVAKYRALAPYKALLEGAGEIRPVDPSMLFPDNPGVWDKIAFRLYRKSDIGVLAVDPVTYVNTRTRFYQEALVRKEVLYFLVSVVGHELTHTEYPDEELTPLRVQEEIIRRFRGMPLTQTEQTFLLNVGFQLKIQREKEERSPTVQAVVGAPRRQQ